MSAILFSLPQAFFSYFTEILSSPKDTLVTVDPTEVLYTRNSISQAFSDGTSIYAAIQQLSQGQILPTDIPPIRVWRESDTGRWYSLDNRRLFVFKKSGVRKVRAIYLNRLENGENMFLERYTSENGGLSVSVRMQCVGIYKSEKRMKKMLEK